MPKMNINTLTTLAKGLISSEGFITFKKRFKSFLWRSGMLFLTALVAFVTENIGLLELPPLAVLLLGLAAGELSKWLNTQTPKIELVGYPIE